MPADIRFSTPNTPGAFARAARAVADAQININGMGCDIRPGEGWGFIHFLVDDPEAAVNALEATGHEILDIHTVELVKVEPRVGALAEVCETYANRDDNIEVLYIASDNHIVVGTESMRHPIVGRRVDEASYSDTRTHPDP